MPSLKRHLGIEIEYAAINIDKVAKIIQDLYGGEIKSVSDIAYEVNNTELGDFKIELDATFLVKAASYNKLLNYKQKNNLYNILKLNFTKIITKAGMIIVPFEIVGPPIKFNQLKKLEKLRNKLHKAGAEDTKSSFYYAFGLHLNPEAEKLEANYILRILQSFLLLYPYLLKLHEVDFARRLTSFIEPFGDAYKELVLSRSYNPDLKQLIYDYYSFNPTRNRPLDLLPIFKYIREDYVNKLFGTNIKINKRPTFHYRLPNCDLINRNHSFTAEFERWMMIEKLANNQEHLNQLIDLQIKHNNSWFSTDAQWINILKNHSIKN